jgi:hypothetical protein
MALPIWNFFRLQRKPGAYWSRETGCAAPPVVVSPEFAGKDEKGKTGVSPV